MAKNRRNIPIPQDGTSQLPITRNSDKTFCIYRIVCTMTGKGYIGQTAYPRKRKISHFSLLKCGKHPNTRLQDDYNEYGRQFFYFEALEDGVQESHASKRERWWIAHFDSYCNGYNMTAGPNPLSGPCVYKGIEYPSLKALSEATNVSVAGIKQGYLKVAMI